MVNENFDNVPDRLPLWRFGRFSRPRPNPAARLLEQGDIVKPNFRNVRFRNQHPPGVILDIDGGIARVQWKDRLTTPENYELKLLVKVDSWTSGRRPPGALGRE